MKLQKSLYWYTQVTTFQSTFLNLIAKTPCTMQVKSDIMYLVACDIDFIRFSQITIQQCLIQCSTRQATKIPTTIVNKIHKDQFSILFVDMENKTGWKCSYKPDFTYWNSHIWFSQFSRDRSIGLRMYTFHSIWIESKKRVVVNVLFHLRKCWCICQSNNHVSVD